MSRSNDRERGFALFIIAALFMAFALVAAAAIDRTNATQQIGMQQRTREQLTRLSRAILQYSIDHGGLYPCPAANNLAITDTSFGSAVASNICDSGGAPSGTALMSTANISGMVPVRELLPYGIQLNDAFDAWNNRIAYHVDRLLTSGSTPSASNRLVVQDTYTGTSVTYTSPDYILESFGKDGLGAIPKAKTAVAIACPASGLRRTNCDGDKNFIVQPIINGPSTTTALYYDDILDFYAK